MNVENLIPKPKTKFLKVKCSGCGNEQIIFSAASHTVKCSACENVLAHSTGSKAIIESDKVEELN